MAKDWINLGTIPYDEDCAQTGVTIDHEKMNKIECQVLIEQLEETFPESVGMYKRNTNHHDFGTYYDVEIGFEEGNEQQMDIAFKVEENYPANWTDKSKERLKELGYKL